MEFDGKISIQPYWTARRRNIQIYRDPESGRPLMATYELESPFTIEAIRTVPGTLITGFSIALDRTDLPIWVAGTILRATDIPVYGTKHWFGCHLYPGVFTQTFGVPNDLLPPEGALLENFAEVGDLADRIRSAPGQRQRSEIAYAYVMQQLAIHRKMDFRALPFYLADRILSSGGALSVQELAQETVYCPRYLQRVLQQNVGAPPKSAINNVRLQAALRLLTGSSKTLTQIAQECGYYDQAHFVHSFQQMMGCSPRSFCRLQAREED